MIGKTILHYEIIKKLGEGGMGVVYLAKDTKLDRNVALKFLPAHSLSNQEDKDRFIREAKAAASLNHANIAHIYEINENTESDGSKQMFIAMEYIEGKTLEEILQANGGTPLPIKIAIKYIIQIAEGMQTAHENGIVHRDIKTANIMVNEKDQIKIMDFGLAKLTGGTKVTKLGTTMGTVAYMSPEQANGEKVDNRTDIWSLGVVMYEMICGQLPFRNDYEQGLLYSILNEEPEPLTAMRTGVPILLDDIIRKALAKDPAMRYQHVDQIPADLKTIEIKTGNVTRISSKTQIRKIEPSSTKNNYKLLFGIESVIATLTILVLLWFLLFNKSINNNNDVSYLNIDLSNSTTNQLVKSDVASFSLSPDSKNLVFTTIDKGITILNLRKINSFESVKIDGTENARSPFISPDSKWIGFVANGKLKRVPINGGVVEILTDAIAFRGASWGPDNKIIFSPLYTSGLYSYSVGDGKLTKVTILDSTKNERTHRWPQVLPGGEFVLFTIGTLDNPNSYVDASLVIQSLQTGKRHILNIKGEMARYIEPGILLVTKKGKILAAPFDLTKFKITNFPLTVLNNVDGEPGSGFSNYNISNTGNIVYLEGTRDQDLNLVWKDRGGNIKPILLKSNQYSMPRISPDGKKLAILIGMTARSNIWLYDFRTKIFNKFTFNNTVTTPIWAPDSKGIYYISGEKGFVHIKYKSVVGNYSDVSIYKKKNSVIFLHSISNDKKYIILSSQDINSGGNLFVLNLKTKKEFIKKSKFLEYEGSISPNNKYLVYMSNETGKFEVYVTTFPKFKSKWQISNGGGNYPSWNKDGKELLYISPSGKLISVPVKTNSEFVAGKPKELLDVTGYYFPNNAINNYDITPDGKRFIFIKSSNNFSKQKTLNIILNWKKELLEKIGQ